MSSDSDNKESEIESPDHGETEPGSAHSGGNSDINIDELLAQYQAAHLDLSDEQRREVEDELNGNGSPEAYFETSSSQLSSLASDSNSSDIVRLDANSNPEPIEKKVLSPSKSSAALAPKRKVIPYEQPALRFDYDPGDMKFSYEPLSNKPVTEIGKQLILSEPEEAFSSFGELNDEGDILSQALQQYMEGPSTTDGSELDVRVAEELVYEPEEIGFRHVGSPEELLRKLESVGYICMPFVAAQIALLLRTELNSISTVMLEGPSGCGKSFLAKSLAKVTGAELMVLQCYNGMEMEHLIEKPSTLGMVKAMASASVAAEDAMELGIISRAFMKSNEKPVILLVDEIDKADWAIDTFFLGPIQDGIIYSESAGAIHAKLDNLLIMFTKNMERPLNDALLRRCQPISMEYMKPELERKILGKHCAKQLVDNLVHVAHIMRNADEAYRFERPPAPEELLKTGKYVTQLLQWHITDYAFIGKNIWYMLAKSERDRDTLERMLRFHPDFYDPLVPDGRKASKYQIFSRLGRVILKGLVEDPDEHLRDYGYEPESVGFDRVGNPDDLVRKLGEVGYQCLPFVASQMGLLLNTPAGRVRGLLLEGPSGCGKSFMAKCLAKITGAELMVLQCYEDMNTKHLIEAPSEVMVAMGRSGTKPPSKEELVNLGIISRAFLKSQSQPVILLVDEIDKVGSHIDTFFLGPLQDGIVWPESRDPIDANMDNLLVIFTKNMNRGLDQALLRRLHPIRMTYLDSRLERKILSKHCVPQLVANLVGVAERMRNSDGSYQFDRPPAPEELLTCGHYVSKLLEWGNADFGFIGKSIWNIIAKSERDRAVLDYMLRHHPDFEDPLVPDAKNAPKEEIHARLGRWVLKDIVRDPDAEKRSKAWDNMNYN